MIYFFAGALVAVIFGIFTAFRKRTPLFYKILFFSMVTCLMGAVYSMLYDFLWTRSYFGFHVGYLGFVGMFFFLYSAYYGAYDSIADGKETFTRKYRVTASILAVCCFLVSLFLVKLFMKGMWMLCLHIPMSLTFYFAVKHLIIPDVEMGIIKVMRSFNAVIIMLCLVMTVYFYAFPHTQLKTISGIGTGILLAVSLPVARNGVRKWFI